MTTTWPQDSTALTVLVVDDNTIYSAGLAAALRSERGIGEVVEAHTVEAGVHLASEHDPDVILLDLQIGADWGLRVARVLRFRGHRARIAVVTNEATPYSRKEAAELGVVGFLDKSSLEYAGMPALVRALAVRTEPIDPDTEGLEVPLTDREIEFLVCFREALGTRAIQERLNVGEQRVRNVTSDIGKKLGVAEHVPGYDNRSLRLALVKRAIRLGIIAPTRPL